MMRRDFGHALRALGRRPAFSAVVIATLALAIGANTTVFSVWNALFERPLQVEEPDRLVGIYGQQAEGLTAAAFQGYLPISWLTLRDLGERSEALAGVYAMGQYPVSLTFGSESERAEAQYVSAEYFDVVGVQPALGRAFRPEEDDAPGSGAVAVLAHGFWRDRLGADPDAVGSTVTVNGEPFTVVGVAPPEFAGTAINSSPDLWVPISMFAARRDWGVWLENRSARLFMAGGRLAPGVTLEAAEQDARAVAAALSAEYPEIYGDQSLQLVPTSRAAVTPNLTETFLGGTAAVMALAGLVLLIACMNVANLLLARALGREREMAIRTSVGAGRGRLVLQLMTETLVLFLLGGALGALLAWWSQSALSGLRPPLLGGSALDLRLDLPVLAFTVGLTLVASLLFGLLPAVRASRTDLAGALREGGSHGLRGAGWARNGLVVGQVALSVVALVAAGLFLRGLARATTMDLGFRTEGVGVLSVDLGAQGYDPEEGIVLYRRLLDEVAALPDVEAVALAQYRPLAGSALLPVAPRGVPFDDPDGLTYVRLNAVTPSYARTLGLRVDRGRWLEESDGPDDPEVVVVNRHLAETLWPGGDAVGQVLQVGPDGHEATVVGVVPTGRYVSMDEDPQPALYTPVEQTYPGGVSVFVRGAATPDGRTPVPGLEAVRRVLDDLDPRLPVFDVEAATRLVDQALWNTRALAWLMAGFGGVGLFLAALGIYGVVSGAVQERRREMGLRLALGAEPTQVLRRVLGGALVLVALGATGGLVAAALVGGQLAELIHGVSPLDPATYALVAVSLVLVAVAAAWIPARRAARVDPLETLRAD